MDSPAWLRDLHSWLGGLTIAFTVVHMVTLIADSYVKFDIVDVLVPFASSYRPWPVAAGVAGFWMLVMVQMTSVFMRKIPRAVWRRIHQVSWILWVIIAFHALTAGSDVGTPLFTGFSMALVMTGTAVGGIRWVTGRSVARRTATKS
jgi:predicted ferric reductase